MLKKTNYLYFLNNPPHFICMFNVYKNISAWFVQLESNSKWICDFILKIIPQTGPADSPAAYIFSQVLWVSAAQ